MGIAWVGRVVCYIFVLPVLCAVDNPTLNDVLAALERTVNYYLENHKDVNLDGIYGLRVVEGQILQILSRHSAGRYPHLSPSLVARLETIQQHAHNISESALPYLKAQDKIYYNRLKPLIDSPLAVFLSYRRLDHSLRWTGDFETENAGLAKFDEEFSDRCMSELMGTTWAILDEDKAMEQEMSENGKCKPTVDCLKVMFSRGREEYELTHQLLFTLLAEQMRCTSVLDNWLRENEEPLGVKQLQLEFCTNNFAEIQEKIHLVKGQIYPIYQDLFMEQQFVCPVLGFMEFLHFDWLKQILSWQHPSGCFGKMDRQLSADFLKKKHVDYYEDDDKNDQEQPQHQPRVTTRHIRDQFGLQEMNAVVKQANDSILELHHAPLENAQDNLRFNQELPFGQDNAVVHSTSAAYANDRFAPKVANQAGQPLGGFDNHGHIGKEIIGADENQGELDPLGMRERDLNPDSHPNLGQGQGDPMEPFGGNVQGFHRDQLLEDDHGQSLLDPRDNFPMEQIHHREGFRRLLADSKWTGRKLLVEKRLAGGCLSHKTAVAAGALSQYLRFMIDPGTAIYGDDFKLDGVNLLMQPLHYFDSHKDSQGLYDSNVKAKNLVDLEESQKDYPDDQLGENQEEDDDDYANEKEDLGNDPQDANGRDVDGDDYADADDAADDEDEDEEDPVNPKMKPVLQAPDGNNIQRRPPRQQNGDKEYEQYIDDEEEQNLALNVDAVNQRRNAGNQKNDPFDVLNKQHQEEESYSYYDNQEDHPGAPGGVKKIIAAKEPSTPTDPLSPLAPNPLVSPTKLYLFVTAFTVVILYFMFKFVRRRRVIIRYYHH